MAKEKVTRSSGNVFADLGLKNAGELALKARIALLIKHLIEAKSLSQVQAADLMGMAQSDVSNIIRGKLAGFSLERLLEGVQTLNTRVEIKVKDQDTGRVLMSA